MNRAQRRRVGIKKKIATYNFIQEQLRTAISEDMEEYKDKIGEEVTNQAPRVIVYVPLLVLHDKWGFGKKRLEKFLFEFAEQIDCLEKDYVGFEDMISVIKDETDLDVSEYIKFWGDRNWIDKL